MSNLEILSAFSSLHLLFLKDIVLAISGCVFAMNILLTFSDILPFTYVFTCHTLARLFG